MHRVLHEAALTVPLEKHSAREEETPSAKTQEGGRMGMSQGHWENSFPSPQQPVIICQTQLLNPVG